MTLVDQINSRLGTSAPKPAGMPEPRSTATLDVKFFRCLLHGDIGTGKTYCAAKFGSPEDVRIIFSRNEDQLIALRGEDYKYQLVQNFSQWEYACKHPDEIWPDWAKNPNRVLVIDDITRAKDFALDANQSADFRKSNWDALDDVSRVFDVVFAQPQHIIAVTLTYPKYTKIDNEEQLWPDLPPRMGHDLVADFSFVFYLDGDKKKLRTSEFRQQFQVKDNQGKDVLKTRIVAARHKLPKELVSKGILKPEEDANLAAIWQKIRDAGK